MKSVPYDLARNQPTIGCRHGAVSTPLIPFTTLLQMLTAEIDPGLYGAFFVKGVPQGSYPFCCTSEFLCSTWCNPFLRPDPRE